MYVCYVDGKSLDEKSNIQLGALRSNAVIYICKQMYLTKDNNSTGMRSAALQEHS